eukprot:365631-Chlamydomonas_euryale.AAC.2
MSTLRTPAAAQMVEKDIGFVGEVIKVDPSVLQVRHTARSPPLLPFSAPGAPHSQNPPPSSPSVLQVRHTARSPPPSFLITSHAAQGGACMAYAA